MKPFSSLFPMGLLALLLLTLRLPAAAQAPAWQSAQVVAAATAAAGNNHSEVTATAIDAVGNVYLAGAFKNSVVLGSTTLTSLGDDDIFVAKFNPVNNQFIWAQRAGGTGNDNATALSINGPSIYVAGSFGSSIADFGPITLTNAGVNTAFGDVFVAKLADAGNTGSFIWAQRAGGMEEDIGSALVVNGTNVYVAGSFGGYTAGFGPITLTNTDATGNTYDMFVAKLTDAGSTGNFVWAQSASGMYIEFASALAVSGNSVYVAGGFESPTVSFGPNTLANAVNTGTYDMFVAKITDVGSTGSFAWAQRAGGTEMDYATALAVSSTSIYVAGTFESPTAGFGSTSLINADATISADIFVAKLTNTGNFVWARRAGGMSDDDVTSLALSGTNLYVAGGFYSSTADFGATNLANVASGNYSDVYVAKLMDAGGLGSFVWAQRAGGMGGEEATALAVSGTNVYVVGYFNDYNTAFGTIILSNVNPGITHLGFLASLTDPTLTATTAAAGPREPASLFPNPARHAATLRLPAGTAPAPLTLTDALGRAVRHYPAPIGTEAALDLRGLPAGLYLLRGAGPAQRLAVE